MSKAMSVERKRNTPGTAGAKIMGETNFYTREILRSGSKAKDGEREKKRGLNDGNNNGQATHGERKPPEPKYYVAADRWVPPCKS